MEVMTTNDRAADGRPLIHVQFERLSPGADAPVLEVVYHIQWPLDFTIVGDNIVVLIFLSCTRTDTREAVGMEPDELEMVLENATNHAASMDQNW
jgi:hypothetical protein